MKTAVTFLGSVHSRIGVEILMMLMFGWRMMQMLKSFEFKYLGLMWKRKEYSTLDNFIISSESLARRRNRFYSCGKHLNNDSCGGGYRYSAIPR
jgi:hypothetical protein